MSNVSTKQLCVIAMLAALATVANIFTIPLDGATKYITLTYTVAFVAGVFMGPFAGFTVGCLGDLMGCIIAPQGAIMPTILLASGLLGVIPWVVFKVAGKMPLYVKIIISFVLIYLICSIGINSTTIYYLRAREMDIFAFLISRLPMQGLVAAVNCIFICIVYNPLKKIFLRFGLYESYDKDNKKIKEAIEVER